ncbi:translational elongation factor EF-1 alpha [Ceratobasidium sp. 394]|nr:translational elongation factor EF-1 alpha [Ceratobasidium sp. 394]
MTSTPKPTSRVLVLGAGNFGSCLADHLADSTHQVYLWARSRQLIDTFNKERRNEKYLTDHMFPEGIEAIGPDLPSAGFLGEVDVVLFAVPTQALRAAPTNARNKIPLLIFVNKGIEAGAQALTLEIIAETCGKEVARASTFLSGPSFAKEKMPLGHSLAASIAVFTRPGLRSTCLARNLDVPAWQGALVPHLELVAASPEPTSIARELLLRSSNEADGDEGEDLYNCQFSLAYGAKILLNTANQRGHRYGLCGRNGSGRSTLMRAITNGQVEGFPSPDEVRTCYVERDIDGSDADTSVLQFILQDKRVARDQKEVTETLESPGFNGERHGHAVGSLSGGWKMKLALAHAMLFKADILLLDEPTNHLAVVNLAWLENYLTSLKACTSIIVSHDLGFLNNTITDVLHLNRFKIKRYHGNLEAFVKAKSYTLEATEDYKSKLLERKIPYPIPYSANIP